MAGTTGQDTTELATGGTAGPDGGDPDATGPRAPSALPGGSDPVTTEPKDASPTLRAAWEIQAMDRIDWLRLELGRAGCLRSGVAQPSAVPAREGNGRRPPQPSQAAVPAQRGATPAVAETCVAALVEQHLQTRLDAATKYLTTPPGPVSWLRGTRVDGAWTHIHAAHALLVEVAAPAQLPALLDHARYAAAAYLPSSDRCHRRLAVLAEAAGKDDTALERERGWLANVLRHAYRANADDYVRLRRYRNSLLGWSVAFLLLTFLLAVVGLAKPEAIPLCFEGASTVCPLDQEPRGGDVALVGLLGLVGGAIGGANSLARSTRATAPAYSLRIVRLLFKLGVGSLAAILGLLFLGAGLAPGFSTLSSRTAILAYAVVFGVAQQLVTRLADQTADRVTRTAVTGSASTGEAGEAGQGGQAASRAAEAGDA